MFIGNQSFEMYLIHLFLLRIAAIRGFELNIAVIFILAISLILSYPVSLAANKTINKIFIKV